MSNKILGVGIGVIALGLIAALASKTQQTSNNIPDNSLTNYSWTQQVSQATGIDELKIELARLQMEVAIATQNYLNADVVDKVKYLALLAKANANLAAFLSAHPELSGQSNTTSATTTDNTTTTVQTSSTVGYSSAPGIDPHAWGVEVTTDGYIVWQDYKQITICTIYDDRVEVSHPNGWLTAANETWYKSGSGSYHTEQYYYHVNYRERHS